MFRSKKKKGATGGVARKRKEIDADSGDEAPHAAGSAAATASASLGGGEDVDMHDDAAVGTSAFANQDAHESDAAAPRGKDRDDADGAQREEQSVGNDAAEDDEEALLERMRNRVKRGKTKSSMTFSSSKSSSSKRKSSTISSSATQGANASRGSLSFEDEESAKTSGGSNSDKTHDRSKKMKIRPNLLVATPVVDEDAVGEPEKKNAYTFEMLDALRKEQNVLLRSALENEENADADATPGPEPAGDIGMEEMDGATIVVDEQEEEQRHNSNEDEEEEEFIPLHSKMMQTRKKRNRVTFGVHSDRPKLSKTTEVDEPTDDEEDDQSRQWEEELMRRGGHHAPLADSEKVRSARDSSKAYPTRKRVSYGSLSDVLTKLQKSFDAASFENDRAERELARIDAEVSLIEESLQKQRQELLTSSEEFEYFQVVEDYVKGLSFCLREKMPEIEANEKEIANMRVSNIRGIRDSERREAQDQINKLEAHGVVAHAGIRGLHIFEVDADSSNAPVTSELDMVALAKLKRGFVDRMPAIQQDAVLDIFADAIEDMNSLQHVYGRFQEWRSKFPDVYKNCYCDIALEKLFAPYVRAELLFWDPLSASQLRKNNGTSWGFDSFEWFQVLRQHFRSSAAPTESKRDDPTVSLIRDVVLGKVLDATTSYFDPCSSLHTRSVGALLEEMSKYGYTQHCEHALTALVDEIAAQFASESKQIPLVAVRQPSVAGNGETISSTFATYQLSRFNALLDNLLTFFVALPREAGKSQVAAFRCVMQVLHQLLAYLNHCQQTSKTLLVPQATQTVSQLTSSPYLQQLLSSSSQEQELQHILQLFAPFVATS